MIDFGRVLEVFTGANVRFVLVGGGAAIVHGSARLTQDVDLVYDREPSNVERMVAALAPFNPYLRGAPPGLPFRWDVPTVVRGLNFILTTDLGPIDLLGEITAGGGYEDVAAHSIEIEAFGVKCLCIDLPTLIRVKRAAGRPKDLEAVAELEALLDEDG